MQGYVRRCGHMARMFSIGQSKEGRSMLALELSNNVGAVEAKPNARFVGNMHGDEPASRCRWATVFLLYAQRGDCARLCSGLLGVHGLHCLILTCKQKSHMANHTLCRAA